MSINREFELNNGIKIPNVGLGVWKTKDGEEVENAILTAINAGYRHIDTASFYKNEEGVGTGIKKANIDRSALFITTKVWNADQGYENTLAAFNTSLEKLQLEYIDLYLIHWPVAGKFTETWKALELLYVQGKVKAIGVCNFFEHHLETLAESATLMPMVNQMECHPKLVQANLQTYCKEHNIQYEAWSPLMQGLIFDNELLQNLAVKYNKTVAQIVLRWNLQRGVVVIPKSINPTRIQENIDIYDFDIHDSDMVLIDSLDENFRVGPDPDNFDF